MVSALNASLSDSDLEQLAELLESNSNRESLSLESMDGLFCALIASPESVPPSVYLPVVLGGDLTDGGAFANEEEAELALSLIMRYWNSIIADLERDAEHLPFVFELEAGEVMGREWAAGFMTGVDLAPAGWAELLGNDAESDMFVIPLLAGDLDPDWPKEPMTAEASEDLLHSLTAALTHCYRHFAAARRSGAVVASGRMGDAIVAPYQRTAPKVGRNDPCPCGSGQKYKKCCGVSAPELH
jgi:uncharacterized protein